MHKHLCKLFFLEEIKRAVLAIYCNILVIYVFSKVALFMFHIQRVSNGRAFKRKAVAEYLKARRRLREGACCSLRDRWGAADEQEPRAFLCSVGKIPTGMHFMCFMGCCVEFCSFFNVQKLFAC